MASLNLTVPKELEPFLRVGASSWKYGSWHGLLYPAGARDAPGSYLAEYARHLRTVEIDQWFWSLFPPGVKLPEPQTVATYAQAVPDDFLFAVKAPNAITLTHFYARQPKRYAEHANRPNAQFLSVDLLNRFLESLAPLGGKLGPILFQFEYLNRTKMPSLRAFLDKLHEFFSRAPGGFRYAVETRNPNYVSQAFFNFLKEHRLGYVFIEGYYMPHIGDVFAKHDAFTTDFSVVRLHGRSREEIEAQTGETWNRLVEPQEQGLEATASIIQPGTSRGLLMLVYANNHFEGCAPLTLERLLELLRQEGRRRSE